MTSQSTQDIKIDYTDCEYVYPNVLGQSIRGARVLPDEANSVDVFVSRYRIYNPRPI